MDLEGLSVICTGLGFAKEDVDGARIGYTKGEFCLDNLKDLQRFLRRDDPQTRDVFKQICKWNTVSHHLIPIIEHYQNDRSLVINAVKVLVFLTMPIDPASDNISQQIEYLWSLKAATTRNDTIAVIVSLLEDPLEHLEQLAFTEDDWKLVQLVLTLFRNILAVQDISLQQKASGSATQYLCLKDRFLELLFHENVMDLILVLTQHVADSHGYLRQDNLLLLETFHYVFLGQDPELIAKASQKGSKVDGYVKTSLNSLRYIVEEEEEKKRLIRLRNLDRYSQFSGTFTRLHMDGSKKLLKGNPATSSGDSLLKACKVQRGPLKRIAWDHASLSLPKENILELLHEFINQFLSGGYNVLMQSIREDIEKEHHAIEINDIIVFFQVAHFVTAVQHQKISISKSKTGSFASEASPVSENTDSTLFYGDICGPIAATMNEAMFSLVICKWRDAFCGLKETNAYKFVSSAGSLMKYMIRMLDLVLKLLPEDAKEPQTARILLYKIFYDQTEHGMTQFLVDLIRSFDNHKQPKSDLADLVEIMHIVLWLMENLQARGTLRVSRKSRKGRKKKMQETKNATDTEVMVEEHADVPKDDDTDNHIGSATGELVADSKILLEEHQGCQTSNKKEERSSVPGHIEKQELPLPETGNLGDDSAQTDTKKLSDTVDDMTYGTGDSSDNDQPAAVGEVDFSVSKLVATFANNTIIQNLCWLLKFYKSNSASTNHYIICMLRRICDDLELSPMLYQLSLLTTFYDILSDQKSQSRKEYENVVSFLTKLVRKLLKKMQSQPLLFVDILFWKTRKECHYINSESLLHELGNLKKESRKWGSILADEDESGFLDGNGRPARRSIADALGEDDFEITHEINHQTDDGLSGGNLPNALHKTKDDLSGGNSFEHESQKVSKRKSHFSFDEDQENNIKNLYEKYKDSRQCSRLIAEALDPDGKISPVQVSRKLKQLGLKAVPKKKMHHVNRPFPGGDDHNQAEGTTTTGAILPSHELEDGSFPRNSSHSRKRIRAFSKEQELMVKDLFEQFKSHKRCAHMIANALDADNLYTAAQISRKLKQLGLQVPQKREQLEAGNYAAQDAATDLKNSGTEEPSDEETLQSLKVRRKATGKLISKEVTVSSASKRRIGMRLQHEDDLDDEILSTIFKRNGKTVLHKPKDDKLGTSLVQETGAGDELTTTASHNVIERYASSQVAVSGTLRTDVGAAANLADSDLDAKLAKSVSPKQADEVSEDVGLSATADQRNWQSADELADSGDDVDAVVPKSTASRRKLMIIDFEDDE